MKLKIKFLKWSAGIPVVMLNNKTAENLGVYSKDRVILKTISKPAKWISTIVDTIGKIVAENEVVVSSELKDPLEIISDSRGLISDCMPFLLSRILLISM